MLADRMRLGQKLPAVSVAFQATAEGTSVTSFSQSMAFGAEHWARKCVVALCATDHEFSNIPAITSVTIGGETATRVANTGNAGGVYSIYVLNKPMGGTSFTVVVNFTGTMRELAVGSYRVLSNTPQAATAATDTDVFKPTSETDPILTPNMSVPANSGLIVVAGAATNDTSAAAITWSTLGATDFAQTDNSGNHGEGNSRVDATATTYSENLTFAFTWGADSQPTQGAESVGFAAVAWSAN